MSVSYNKLWKLLIDKGYKKNILRDNGIHPTAIAKMGRNECVSMQTLETICKCLKCDFGDIVEYVPDESEE